MELPWWTKELERLGVSGLLSAAGFSALGVVWRRLVKREGEIRELSMRNRSLCELLAREKQKRIDEQKAHSLELRETIKDLRRSLHEKRSRTSGRSGRGC